MAEPLVFHDVYGPRIALVHGERDNPDMSFSKIRTAELTVFNGGDEPIAVTLDEAGARTLGAALAAGFAEQVELAEPATECSGDGASVMAGECRSEAGVTVGLVDALIAICRVLAPRDLTQAKDALADLASDEDFGALLAAAGKEPALSDVEQTCPGGC